MTIVDFSEATIRTMLMYMYGCLPDMPKRHYDVSQDDSNNTTWLLINFESPIQNKDYFMKVLTLFILSSGR